MTCECGTEVLISPFAWEAKEGLHRCPKLNGGCGRLWTVGALVQLDATRATRGLKPLRKNTIIPFRKPDEPSDAPPKGSA